jgi:hypothetical protein
LKAKVWVVSEEKVVFVSALACFLLQLPKAPSMKTTNERTQLRLLKILGKNIIDKSIRFNNSEALAFRQPNDYILSILTSH